MSCSTSRKALRGEVSDWVHDAAFSKVDGQPMVRQQVCSDNGGIDISNDEGPKDGSTKSKVECEEALPKRPDDGTVCCVEFELSRLQLGVGADGDDGENGSGVDQKIEVRHPVRDEETRFLRVADRAWCGAVACRHHRQQLG